MYKRLGLILIIILALNLSACKKPAEDTDPVEPREDLPKVSADYKVAGESDYWETSLDYTMRENNKVWVEGDIKYTGDNLPEKASIDFNFYDIRPTSYNDEDGGALSISLGLKNRRLEDSKIQISEKFDREHKKEVYEEAIGHGYIKIDWKEGQEDKREKISIKILE